MCVTSVAAFVGQVQSKECHCQLVTCLSWCYSSMMYVKSPIVMSSAAQVMYSFGRCMCFTSICIGPCEHVELVSIPELSK